MSNEEKRRYKSFFTSEGSLGAFRSRAQISAERALAHQCGCAAWLTFFPCGTAFAAHDWRVDGSSALNGTLSFESTIPDTEKNEYGMIPASWTQNDGDAKGRVALTGVIPDTPVNIFGALVESGKGNAYESSVSLTGGSFLSGSITGGAVMHGSTGNAYANTVTIEDSSVKGWVADGVVYDSLGNAYDNAVSISGASTISIFPGGFGGVYGGHVRGTLGKADRNAVTMSGGIMGGPVYGGLVEYSAWSPVNLVSVAESDPAELSPEPLDVTADNNTVALSGVGVEISTDTLSGAGEKRDGIFGGCVRISEIYPGINVSADTNATALSHVSASGARVYGGLIESGFAYLYPVRSSGSSDSVLSSVSLSASGNSVFLEQSSTGDVYGGTIRTGGQTYAYSRFQRSAVAPEFAIMPPPTVFTAHADGNTVGIADSSAVSGDVHGGLIEYGMSGSVMETPVLMMSFLVPDTVQPEAAPVVFHGSADSNTVSIAGTAGTLTVDGNVYGGIVRVSPASVDALAQSEFSVTAEKNTVILAGGSTVSGSVYGGSVFGSSASAEVSEESFQAVRDSVSGDTGSLAGSSSVTASVSGNTVRIEGGSTVTGSVYGGYTETGRAEGNFVYIDGTVSGGAEGGHTLSGDASGNIIVMEGGSVSERLYGGYDDGTAVNNTVTLYGTASFAGSDLYGGRSGGTSSDVFTGNTLNLHGQIQADSLQNFQNLNFSDVAEGTPSADLAKSAVLGDGKGSFTSVSIQSLRNQPGNVPEEYVLVHTPSASSSSAGTNLYVNGASVVTISSDGSYVPYTGTVSNDGTLDNETGTAGMTSSQSGLSKGFLTFDVDYFIKNGQDLIARTKNVQADHRTKAFNVDRLPGLALVDQGGDLVAGAGMESAAESAMCLPGEEPCGTRAFMTVTGGYSTYKTDTHFNMTSGNAMVGLARYCKLRSVGFLAGVFFEAGLSRFNAEHEYAGYDSFDSDGNAGYYGVGALGKLYLNETAMQGLYAEGSFRIGMLNYNWDADGWRVNGSEADYSSESPYMAAHGGLGWMKSVTDNVDLDIYAKYLWSHVSEDDGSISGSRVNFDAMDSNRLRGGARLSFKGSDVFSWYLGAAYERQFNGRSTSDIYGHDTPSASLTGDTAMVEAGLRLRPAEGEPLFFTLGATGYGGVREGVSGLLQVHYEF
ncbi:MAG: autotransporter outer membrane beta-barrel domain-containing protein [Desulfovibrio sp.]|nr:autotransporter outer membrane beta-barrel domain-containing protein [Desulfovibrio sp.]